MNDFNTSRRVALKKLASASVIGAVSTMRSRSMLANQLGEADIPGVRGKVILRQDHDYESWRQSMIWHTWKPQRYPDMIVRASSEEDVIAVVRYAAQNGLKLAVRSGGHNPLGPSLRDGGVCLDLSGLAGIEVDSSRQLASIQTGVRSVQLIANLAAYGLCFPTPHCATVGMGGFLLGGGLGWNHPYRSGVATFNIEAAELVTADGKRLMASADENPELFWAVRGGGPGLFAVVTRLYLKVYPAPKSILASSYIFPLERLDIVTRELDRISADADQRVEILAVLIHDPTASPDVPAEQSKICFVTAFAFGDSVEEARALLAPVAKSGMPAAAVAKDEHQLFTFDRLYPEFFGLDKPGGYRGRYACDSAFTNVPGEILLSLADHFRRAPSPICHVIASYGLNLKHHEDACFSATTKHYVGCFSIWDEERDDARCFKWLDEAIPVMDRFARGHYVNEVEVRLHPERIRYCYSDEAWERLQALRRKYDPNGVFHTYLGQT